MDKPILEVRHLSKSFDGHIILKDISFTVARGEVVVIMGVSGGGKTTLLWNLVGIYQPDAGEIFYWGQNFTKMDLDEIHEMRKRFGILFQSGALYNSMTVGDNIRLALREHTNLSESVMELMVKMKLELVGLRDAENMFPAQLSGGMKKRAALARAIAMDPEILFYDEPTTGLDPIVSSLINQLILDQSKKLGVTSIVVTHHLSSAFQIADRLILLYKGEIVAQGSVDEIQKSKDPVVVQFINGNPVGPIPSGMSSTNYAEDLLESKSP